MKNNKFPIKTALCVLLLCVIMTQCDVTVKVNLKPEVNAAQEVTATFNLPVGFEDEDEDE